MARRSIVVAVKRLEMLFSQQALTQLEHLPGVRQGEIRVTEIQIRRRHAVADNRFGAVPSLLSSAAAAKKRGRSVGADCRSP